MKQCCTTEEILKQRRLLCTLCESELKDPDEDDEEEEDEDEDEDEDDR